jgi:hypothetical protein
LLGRINAGVAYKQVFFQWLDFRFWQGPEQVSF